MDENEIKKEIDDGVISSLKLQYQAMMIYYKE